MNYRFLFAMTIVSLACLISACSDQKKAQRKIYPQFCKRHKIDTAILTKAINNISKEERKKTLRFPKALIEKYGLSQREPQDFLKILCEEYKDYPELLHKRIIQLSQIHTVKPGKQLHDERKPFWQQLTGDGYKQLVFLLKKLSHYRVRGAPNVLSKMKAPKLLTFCEMKFIFKEYLSKQRGIWNQPDWTRYESELLQFEGDARNCNKEDRTHVVNFRGDGSMRPFLPESSAMESYAYLMAKRCKKNPDERCQRYDKSPFSSRLQLNREVLRALFYYDEKHHNYLKVARYPFFLLPDSNGDGTLDTLFPKTKVPNWKSLYALPAHNLAFTLIGKYRVSWREYHQRKKAVIAYLNETLDGNNIDLHHYKSNLWKKEFASDQDNGLKTLFELSTKEGQEELRKRVEASLHRHADFYRTFLYFRQYNSIIPSVSPWSSSSYYINQSHKFTIAGYASDTMKKEHFHWMQIYKVPRERIYTKKDLANGKAPHLEETWIKEPDFGSNRLASEELALDHFALPKPDEFAGLLWLGNVETTNELMEIVRSEGNS